MTLENSDYQYDIFISYRHNDNRSGWVTTFIEAFQEELASVIKEPLSMYYDHNKHDGLLETHNVDKSLEGKLKCRIFIPILSQTYCDPRSFAWQHEFCAFNSIALNEPIGRDIKLHNGNVASRILPVKIHDIDDEDKLALENEISGVLRAIEMIYKEPGVNRPLNESDSKKENQNKTEYRNQINKLANAVKDILSAIAKPAGNIKISTPTAQITESVNDKPSLAVLPFNNLSSDTSQEYLNDGITENIIIELAAIKSLKVISRTSVMRYKKSEKSVPEIAEELDVEYILEGSVQIHGNKIRINVQLIDADEDNLLWSKVFIESLDDIFEIQSKVAEIVSAELQASLNQQISTSPTEEKASKNPAAYDLYLKGRHAFNQWGLEGYKVASEYFLKSIEIDPDFKQAYSALASSYSARMSWNGDLSPTEAHIQIEKYLKEAWKRGPSENDYLTKAFVEFFIKKDFKAAEEFLLKGIEKAPNNASLMYAFSYLLNMAGRLEEASQWVEQAKKLDPLTVAYFNYQTICHYLNKESKQALTTIREAINLYPNVLRLYDYQARVYILQENWDQAIKTVNTGLRISELRPPSMLTWLAIGYSKTEKKEKSQALIKELLDRAHQNEKGINFCLMYFHTVVNELPEAYQWHLKAKATNDVDLIWFDSDPLLEPLRAYKKTIKKKETVDFKGAEIFIEKMLSGEMPNLSYHNTHHIHDVLEASTHIAEHEKLSKEDTSILRIATLLHDIGFIRSSKNHEENGAVMAREILPEFGFSHEMISIIEKMIMATKLPQSPSTQLERVLCDADLDYLGRADFYPIGFKLFEELKDHGIIETEREWNLVQKTFLESHKYHTKWSQKNREPEKQLRLQEIIQKLKK